MSLFSWLQKANPGLEKPAGYASPRPGLPNSNDEPTVRDADSCEAANSAMVECLNSPDYQGPHGVKRKRSEYGTYSPELRASMAKFAIDCRSATKAARHFSNKLGRKINESSIRSMVTQYKKKLDEKPDPDDITALPPAKQGQSTLLPTDIDEKLQKHLVTARRAGAPINRRITIATAYGLVPHHKRHLLPKHGEHLILQKTWADSFLDHMKFFR